MPGMLEEKDAIRELLAEYCFRLDSGWFDGMAALFAENGTWEPPLARQPAARRSPPTPRISAPGAATTGRAASIWSRMS